MILPRAPPGPIIQGMGELTLGGICPTAIYSAAYFWTKTQSFVCAWRGLGEQCDLFNSRQSFFLEDMIPENRFVWSNYN